MLYFLKLDSKDNWRGSLLPSFLLLFFGFWFYPNLFAQQTDVVDFLKIEASVTPNSTDRSVKGTVMASFRVLQKTDSIYLDAKHFTTVKAAQNGIAVSKTDAKIWLEDRFQAGKTYTAFFSYETHPQKTLYFFGNEIWTQGQGKYTSNWLPSLDDVNDKIEFDLTVRAPKDKTVIANGKLLRVEEKDNQNYWHFDMAAPMSSYLVAMAIGNYDKAEFFADSGIPVSLYYKPTDSIKVEPTYRYSKRIFDFLAKEIGVPYPWQNYKQVPVRDFLYAGMENTTATFFSEAFMVDSTGFNDRNYINVNAHELAHQWFGDMVTEKTGEDHWLQEGFATYYALLTEKEIFGDDYYYWQLYQNAEQLKAASDEGKGESLLNPKASSITFYQKGAWALHILRERIGEEAFKKAIENYLEKYRYKNVTTEDFLNEVRAVTDVDISQFKKDWLLQSAFKAEEAYQSLMKSSFIQNYFEISALRGTPLKDKKSQLGASLTFPNDFIGQEAVYQLQGESLEETLPLYKKALESNNLYVRQAVALSLDPVPKELQQQYEELLDDASYVTLKTALYNLWRYFPEKHKEYLDKTEGIIGFQNKNIRQLWLALALVTRDYKTEEKELFLKELKHYSSPEYSFEIREVAFGNIDGLELWDAETLKNLIEACVHPTWRFAKFSKSVLNKVLEKPKYYEMTKTLRKQLSAKAAEYINSITKE